MDQVDDGLLLLVAEHDRAEHHFLGQLLRFRFDHQHGRFGAGDDEVELRCLELGLGRVQHVLAVDVADARRADRAVERNARRATRAADAPIIAGMSGSISGSTDITVATTCTSL